MTGEVNTAMNLIELISLEYSFTDTTSCAGNTQFVTACSRCEPLPFLEAIGFRARCVGGSKGDSTSKIDV